MGLAKFESTEWHGQGEIADRRAPAKGPRHFTDVVLGVQPEMVELLACSLDSSCQYHKQRSEDECMPLYGQRNLSRCSIAPATVALVSSHDSAIGLRVLGITNRKVIDSHTALLIASPVRTAGKTSPIFPHVPCRCSHPPDVLFAYIPP